ncbi:MAG: GNAT family N-acetyltransferase [Sulfobacillus sp.]
MPKIPGGFMVTIRTDCNLPIPAVKALWDKISWAKGRDLETIALALSNSALVVHAWDGQRLIGTARVLTDGAYYATLWDVIVDPEFQAQGIGTQLLEASVAPFIHRGFSFIALFAAEGKEDFYKKHGFAIHPRGMKLSEPL